MRKSDIRQAVLILAPTLLLFGAAMFFLYSNHSDVNRTVTSQRARNNVRIADRMLRHALGGVVSDLQYLADAHEAAAFLSGQ